MTRPSFNCEPQEAPKYRIVVCQGTDGRWYGVHVTPDGVTLRGSIPLPHRPTKRMLATLRTLNPDALVEVQP